MSLDCALSGAADRTPEGPLGPITEAEKMALVAYEAIIDEGLRTFVQVGEALLAVRNGRLYRDDFPTFKAYCEARHGLSRSSAYELMQAAEVVSGLPDSGPSITSVSQGRALAAAPPEERAEIIAAVAAKGDVTAAGLTDEIEARHPKPPAPSPVDATVETGRDPSPAPPSSAPGVAVQEPDPEDEDVCECCGVVDPPGFAGGYCVECWESTENEEPADPSPHCAGNHPGHPEAEKRDPITIAVEISAAAPKPPTLRDLPEVKASDRAWAPAKALGKGLRSMLPAIEVMEVLPADSLESFDHLADEAIAWGKRWKEERKSASRLRLMGVKGVRR